MHTETGVNLGAVLQEPFTLVFNFFILLMCLSVLPAYMSVGHMCAWHHRSQKRVLDPLGLELETDVRHHVNAGDQAQVL